MTPPERELEGGFSRRVLGWVTGVAAASFLAALLASAFGDEATTRPTPDANSFSASAIGHQGLVELLSALGLGVVSSRTPVPRGLGPRTPLVLAEPQAADAAQRRRIGALRDQARAAGAALVLVLPKWRGEPRPDRPGWLRSASLRPAGEIAGVAEALGDDAPGILEVRRDAGGNARKCRAGWQGAPFAVDLRPAQLLVPSPDLEAVVACPGGLLVARLAQAPAGQDLLVIADPDLLNNQGLGRADHAALVHRLLVDRLGARGAVFDETSHGFLRSRGLLAEAFRFPLLPATLQGFLLLAVVLWAGMGRFGKPLPAAGGLAPGKEVLIDNTATLLAHGGHAADSLARYYRQTLRSVAAAFFLPADLPEAEVRQRLQEISRHRGATLELAAVEGQIERLGGSREAAGGALALAGRLHRWRREMIDGRRTDP